MCSVYPWVAFVLPETAGLGLRGPALQLGSVSGQQVEPSRRTLALGVTACTATGGASAVALLLVPLLSYNHGHGMSVPRPLCSGRGVLLVCLLLPQGDLVDLAGQPGGRLCFCPCVRGIHVCIVPGQEPLGGHTPPTV